jgi:amino acid transporter
MNQTRKHTLGVASLVMLSIVAIFNPRTLSVTAEYGLGCIFYYAAAALLYFIPFSLVCAELATAWPEKGGLYVWSKEAFGQRFGFFTIWIEWINNVVGWPASLALIAATLAYSISPSLAQDKLYTIVFMLCLFWLFTFINWRGIIFSSIISNVGLIIGTLLPTFLIITFGYIWLVVGEKSHLVVNWQAVIPPMHLHSAALFTGTILGLGGMQITAFHANQVRKPKTAFPIAILIATIAIILISIMGSLAIAIVLPQHSISVVTGNIDIIKTFLAQFHAEWLTPVIAIAIAIGACAMLNTWIGGPSKGLLAAAENGDIPKFFSKQNNKGAPTNILIGQAIVVSLLACLFLFTPTVANSFWLITVLSAIMSLSMNIIIFAAGIRLKYNRGKQTRAFAIPFGKLGMWIISGVGIGICLVGIALGFVTPSQLHSMSTTFYDGFLIVGLIVFVLPGILLYQIGSK